jgi:phytanoyl-CoA hydroxylase
METAYSGGYPGLLFECLPFASQTLGFLRGSAQEAHQDSAYVAYSIARNFAASWIALEDVTADAGELFYYPGSHRMQDYEYGGSYKSVSEALRAGIGQDAVGRQVGDHVSRLPKQADALGLQKKTFLARAGDVLVWHAGLAHGGQPVSKHVTRKSLVTHYCPRVLAPLFMERNAMNVFTHHSGAGFTASQYRNRVPAG